MSLPEPLTPPDCDLRGMSYMPLHGDRLFGSETWISATAEAKVAALKLWWRSFAHEVPAGSLPDNDTLLSEYAGYGVAVKAWQKIKAQAMRGWFLCSDARLYHKTVAEVALEAWAERLRNRQKQARWRERNRQRDGDVTVTDGVRKPSRNAGSEAKLRESSSSKISTDPAREASRAEDARFARDPDLDKALRKLAKARSMNAV